MSSRKYKKPPIQEAIFEVKFASDNFDSAVPGQIFEKIKKNYPVKKDVQLITISVGPKSSQPQGPMMQAWKEDSSEVVQIGQGFISVNKLKYQDWHSFIPAIKQTMDAYIVNAQPNLIDRLGVRYINRFVIPQQNILLSDYFKLAIQIPETLQNLQGFDLTFIHKFKMY